MSIGNPEYIEPKPEEERQPESDLILDVDSRLLLPSEPEIDTVRQLLLNEEALPPFIERAVELGNLCETVGLGKPGISFAPCFSLPTHSAIPALRDNELSVASLSTPHKRGVLGTVRDAFRVKGKPLNFIGVNNLPEHIAWTLTGVPTQRAYRRGIEDYLTQQDANFMLRTSTAQWGTEWMSNAILQLAKQLPPERHLDIAIALSAWDSPTDFEETCALVDTLNKDNKSLLPNVKFFLDFDPVQLAKYLQEAERQPDMSLPSVDSSAVTAKFDTLMTRNPGIVGCVQLDQIDSDGHLHVPLNKGVLDLSSIVEELAKARNRTSAVGNVTAVLEQHPTTYRAIVTDPDNAVLYTVSALFQRYASFRY